MDGRVCRPTSDTFITSVSRQSAFVTSNQKVLSPSASEAGGSTEVHSPRRFQAYCMAAATAMATARATIRGRTGSSAATGAAMKQESRDECRQQQDHAQVIPKPERVDGVKEGEPRNGWSLNPGQQRHQDGADDQQVQGVDLGRNGLRPEGVGKREKQPCRHAGDDRFRKHGCQAGRHAHRDGSVDRRSEVQGTGRLARMEPHKKVAEPVVKGVRLSWREGQRSHAGLERRAIAEIQARQERGVIAEERDDRGACGGQPFKEPGSGGAERGASLVSIGKLAASHSGTPPLRTLILMPLRRSSDATCVLTSSLGSES